MTKVPTVRLDQLSEDQVRAYVIADNKLAEKAGWDESILAIEFRYLQTIEKFDLTITGYDVAEIDLILDGETQRPDDSEVAADDAIGEPVTRTGDLWRLGEHRLICGSALEQSSFDRLMDGAVANAVFVDPPYNVKIDGNVCGKGKIRHREFAMATGEMTKSEFTEFLRASFVLLTRYSSPGSVHYICNDWRHIREVMEAAENIYNEYLNLCVWAKDNGGMGSMYRSQHELVFVMRNGKASHRNNVQLGKYGRNRTNVWQYPGVNTLSKNKEEGNLLALHPTCKPVAMVSDAFLDCTKRGDIVLDSFLGSGTTLMAAERVGRIFRGIELDPLYVDTAIRRWQRYTGQTAVNVATGKSFTELEVEGE